MCLLVNIKVVSRTSCSICVHPEDYELFLLVLGELLHIPLKGTDRLCSGWVGVFIKNVTSQFKKTI